jgi:hypothetical protein
VWPGQEWLGGVKRDEEKTHCGQLENEWQLGRQSSIA